MGQRSGVTGNGSISRVFIAPIGYLKQDRMINPSEKQRSHQLEKRQDTMFQGSLGVRRIYSPSIDHKIGRVGLQEPLVIGHGVWPNAKTAFQSFEGSSGTHHYDSDSGTELANSIGQFIAGLIKQKQPAVQTCFYFLDRSLLPSRSDIDNLIIFCRRFADECPHG